MVSLYEGVIALLEKIGFFNIILPWLLIYAITYGVLLRTKIFGEPFPTQGGNEAEAKQARTLSSIVALSVASLVIGSYQAVVNIRNIIPLFALFILITVCLIIIISAFTLPEGASNRDDVYQKLKKYSAIPASVVFVLVILNYFGFLGSFGGGSADWMSIINENKEIIEVVIIFIFFGLVVWWSTRESKPEQQQQQQQNRQ